MIRKILGVFTLLACLAPVKLAAQSAPASPPGAAVPAAAIVLPPEAREAELLAKSIETAEKSIQQLKELEGELSRVRGEVERIIYASTATADSLRPQLAELRKQIDRLGPAPNKDQPPESPTIASERQRLNGIATSLDSAIKTSELAWVRAKQLIDRITVMRYQMFARNLFERRESPLLPGVWRTVGEEMDTVAGRAGYYGGDWLTWAARLKGLLASLLAGLAALYLVLAVAAGRLIRRGLVHREGSPTFFERIVKAAWVAPLRMLAPGAAIFGLYFGLSELGLLFSPWIGLAGAAVVGLLTYVVASALLRTALSPRRPDWRLVPVSDRTAGRVCFLLEAFVAVFVVDTVLVELARAIYAPLAVSVVQSFLATLTFALMLGLLILTPFEPQVGPDRPVNGHAFVPRPVTRLSPLWIKLPLLVTLIVLLGGSALGYIALGRFIAHQVVTTGTVLAGCGLLYLAIRAATRGRSDNRDLVGLALERRFGLVDPVRRRQLSLLLEVLATFLIAMAALPLLMMQWGFAGPEIRDWLKSLLFGFEVGQFRISLARILIGLGLFTALLFLTRLMQRWLRDSVLAQSRMDAGIANSIDTAIGYVGIGLALLVALSYAGLDITSLAIVAGALSVGIGFGLQSIVNNFVSGLILLVERPIKVGDWIVVGTEQGNVRRISVRSTEIETFDRASLIVPNSELITGRVLNWTHRNPLGRAVVKVQVAMSADPEKVLAILRECADGNENVLKAPPPVVSFDNFSGDALEFTVRAVVGDVYTGNRVATELRVAILKRFRAAGIQPTGPLHEVLLKDLDWVRVAAQRIAAERAGAGEHGKSSPVGTNDND